MNKLKQILEGQDIASILEDDEKHELKILSLYDAMAECTAGDWHYAFTGERTREDIEAEFQKHLANVSPKTEGRRVKRGRFSPRGLRESDDKSVVLREIQNAIFALETSVLNVRTVVYRNRNEYVQPSKLNTLTAQGDAFETNVDNALANLREIRRCFEG